MAEKIEFEGTISRHYNPEYFFVIIPRYLKNKILVNDKLIEQGEVKVTIEPVKEDG